MWRGTRVKGSATVRGMRDALFKTSPFLEALDPTRDVTLATAKASMSKITTPIALYRADTPFLNMQQQQQLPLRTGSHFCWSFEHHPLSKWFRQDPFESDMYMEVPPWSEDVIEMFCVKKTKSTKMQRKRMMNRHKHRKRLKKNRSKTKR